MTITIEMSPSAWARKLWRAIATRLPCSRFGHRWEPWCFYTKVTRLGGGIVSEIGFVRVCQSCDDAQFRGVKWTEYEQPVKPYTDPDAWRGE